MGLYGVLKFIFNRILEISIIVILVLFIPNLPPYSQFTKSIKLPPTKPLKGPLALNGKLNFVELKYKGRLSGPVSFTEFDSELYTGINGGDIIQLTGNHISPIVQTGKPCNRQYEEKVCGRPLGLKYYNGLLYVADAYHGIMSVNIFTGKKKVLISPNQTIDGRTTKFFNGLTVANEGDIFWTASSTEFQLDDGLFELLSDPSGRLVHYNSQTKVNTVLIDKISGASGVALSKKEDFILVAESLRNRILRYYFKGPKKGTLDIFIDGLPGMPGNIKTDHLGAFLVPLVVPVDDEHPNMIQTLLDFPLLRKLIVRTMGITQWIFNMVEKVYPNPVTKIGSYNIGRLAPFFQLFEPPRVTVLRISDHGEILDSLHATNKVIRAVSEAYIFRKYLYLGSSHEDYVARIPLAEIGWQNLNTKDQNK